MAGRVRHLVPAAAVLAVSAGLAGLAVPAHAQAGGAGRMVPRPCRTLELDEQVADRLIVDAEQVAVEQCWDPPLAED